MIDKPDLMEDSKQSTEDESNDSFYVNYKTYNMDKELKELRRLRTSKDPISEKLSKWKN